MTAKKAIGKIHLWLGLASGLVVLFLGITGCILAFEVEIRKLAEPQQFVAEENRPYLPPSVLKEEAEKYLQGKTINGLEYPGTGKSVIAYYYDADNYKLVALNPYTGKMLRVKNMNHDFFRVVLNGHFYLWLPPSIGQPIVASATLIFLIMMITGIVLWWPKNKAARKQRFSVKWNARWRRVNYDLHNVFGFYMSWVAIFLAITGLVMGFEWFAKSVYWVTSAGKAMPENVHPHSDTLAKKPAYNVADNLWSEYSKKKKADESIGVYYALTHTDPMEITINHRPGTYYNMDFYHFDQYTGVELPVAGTYAGNFKNASIPDKIKRMNYDIHVGAVLGLPGKILAFFASLIAASLPVTGFYIWWGRRKKKPARASIPAKAMAGLQT
jgi:uncharacterized iron-regulated membrane protein